MNPRTKTALAGLAAVVALGVAGYLGYSAFGGGRTVRSAADASRDSGTMPGGVGGDLSGGPGSDGRSESGPGERRVELDGPPPAWMQASQDRAAAYRQDFEFPDADSAARSFDDGAVDFALRAESDESLGTLGISARRGLVDSFKAFMRPLLNADRDAFERALRDLGAPDPQGGMALYDRLTGYFEGARVAVGAAQIRSIDPSQPGAMPMGAPNIPNLPEGATAIPMMVGVMEMRDDATGETTTIREVNIPLDAVFPGARDAAINGARTTEVWAPAQFAKTKGSKADLGPSIYFVYDEQARSWTPVAMRVALASESAATKLETMMRSRRGAIED